MKLFQVALASLALINASGTGNEDNKENANTEGQENVPEEQPAAPAYTYAQAKEFMDNGDKTFECAQVGYEFIHYLKDRLGEDAVRQKQLTYDLGVEVLETPFADDHFLHKCVVTSEEGTVVTLHPELLSYQRDGQAMHTKAHVMADTILSVIPHHIYLAFIEANCDKITDDLIFGLLYHVREYDQVKQIFPLAKIEKDGKKIVEPEFDVMMIKMMHSLRDSDRCVSKIVELVKLEDTEKDDKSDAEYDHKTNHIPNRQKGASILYLGKAIEGDNLVDFLHELSNGKKEPKKRIRPPMQFYPFWKIQSFYSFLVDVDQENGDRGKKTTLLMKTMGKFITSDWLKENMILRDQPKAGSKNASLPYVTESNYPRHKVGEKTYNRGHACRALYEFASSVATEAYVLENWCKENSSSMLQSGIILSVVFAVVASFL